VPVDPHWLRPAWLWLLPLIALLLILLVRRLRHERRWEDLVDAPLRAFVLTPARGLQPRLAMALLAAAWLLLVVALAGPAWQLAKRPVFRIEHPRVLLLDLSPSMRAADLLPSRLARARFEVMDLLRSADEGQFALVAFSAEPFLIAPLTTDAGTILEQVPLLDPEVLPVSGERRTDLALEMATRLLSRSSATGGDVLLITDGVGAGAEARAAAAALGAAGHRVSVLALAAHPDFAALAAAGGGIVVDAEIAGGDTARLLALQGRRRVDAGRQVSVDRQWRDDGPWLLLLALPLAAFAFRRGWIGLLPLALVLTPPAPVAASSWTALWLRPEQRALRDAEAGHLERALSGIEDARWRAALHYRAGDYDGALAELKGIDGAEAHYNRGNVLARLGRHDAAVAEYEAALALVPDHADAEHNRRLLLDLMRTPRPAAFVSGDTDDAAGDEEAEVDHAGVGDATAGSADRARSGQGHANVPPTEAADAVAEPPPLGADASAQRSGTGSLPGGRTAGPGDPAEASQQRWEAPKALTGSAPLATPEVDEGAQEPGVAGVTPADAAGDPQRPETSTTDAYLLRQVPDDPAGLLRERLMLQYLRRHGQLH
jgi:Ca-activated chloride channel family protein